LLAAKGRGRDMPVPVLVPTFAAAIALAKKLSPAAKDLMDAFWPGPLTIVVAQQPTLSWDLGDTDGTVALRMPLQRTALELLAETGPLAVSSANISGQPPATSAKMALEQLGESVSIYLEMGETTSDIPSTIVDATSDKLQIIRLGALSKADLVEIVGEIAFKSSDE
jgi:tRNA threonylcarbamoyl adenosine modification protein (Sua5/YciO/YrdC/YwlC family)